MSGQRERETERTESTFAVLPRLADHEFLNSGSWVSPAPSTGIIDTCHLIMHYTGPRDLNLSIHGYTKTSSTEMFSSLSIGFSPKDDEVKNLEPLYIAGWVLNWWQMLQ